MNVGSSAFRIVVVQNSGNLSVAGDCCILYAFVDVSHNTLSVPEHDKFSLSGTSITAEDLNLCLIPLLDNFLQLEEFLELTAILSVGVLLVNQPLGELIYDL